ncbi:MAG TPA: hypothetical protein VJ505_04050 [Holophagaceae bacterium]|nr:hypothetical protein [Holophagaceae bacterium]
MRTVDFEENRAFLCQAETAFRRLFSAAKDADELNFAAALSPEFRPYKQNSAVDAQRAFSDYFSFLSNSQNEEIRPRVALAFYSHLAEASGFWEIVKNLLGIVQGRKYNLMPFAEFTRRYGNSKGSPIPNANALMRSLVKCSGEAGFSDLQFTFQHAFDSNLRNAYAHADYHLSKEGVFFLARYDEERLVSWVDLHLLLEKALNLYLILNDTRIEHCHKYIEPKQIFGSLNNRDAPTSWKVEYNLESGSMRISNGFSLIQFAAYPNLPIFSPEIPQ